MLDSSAYDDLLKALAKLFGEEADESGDPKDPKKAGKTVTIMSISKPKKGERLAIPKQSKDSDEDD